MANIYCGSTKYTAVAQYANSTAYTVGQIVRQLATPTVGNERCFRCSTAGTSGAAEPTWVLTKNATTTAGTAVFTECTGEAAFNGDGGGSAWGAPHARIGNALQPTWSAAGDVIYVSNNHAETQASAITLTNSANGTQANPIKVVCVSDTAVPPTTKATTATVSTTGANGISIQCPFIYFYGIQFGAGSSGSSASINIGANNLTNGVAMHFDNCKFTLNNTNVNSRIRFGDSGNSAQRMQALRFVSCSTSLSSASQRHILGDCFMDWYDGAICVSGSVPTTAFEAAANTSHVSSFRSADMSTLSGNLFNVAIVTNFCIVDMLNCKVAPGGPTYTTGTQTVDYQFKLRVHAPSDTVANGKEYTVRQTDNLGLVTTSNVTFCNQADGDGTDKFSIGVSSVNTSSLQFPVMCPELWVYNTVSGSSRTATIEFTGSGSVTDRIVWAEFEYPNSSTLMTTAIASTKTSDDILSASGTTYATSSATWTNGGGTNQKMTATFTPQRAGPIKCRIYLSGNPSISIDPRITLT